MLTLLTSLSLGLIPYVQIPELNLGPLPIRPFGVLVVTGILVGQHLANKRADKLGLPADMFSSHVFWTVATGIVLSHVFDTIMYYPETLITDPLYVLQIWKGLSSFGGFAGAAIGFIYYGKKHKLDLWRSADAIAFGLPFGWFFGRMGCAVVHDHPGMPSTSFLAVDYPGQPRFDLGMLEMMLTPILMLTVILVVRKTSRPGSVVAILAMVYPWLRFPLDFLRAPQIDGGDVRYFGFTPGQYACFALFAGGVVLWQRAKKAEANAPTQAVKVHTPKQKKHAAR